MSSMMRAETERERFGATGEGIVWAIVDSGIDRSHPHFQRHSNLKLEPPIRHRDLTSPDLDDSDQSLESLVDALGHGTHMAGLIAGEITASSALILQINQKEAASTSDAIITIDSVSGLAPRCKLVSLKVLDDHGEGEASLVIEALRWVRDINRQSGAIQIHGVSLGVWFNYDADQFACGFSPLCAEVNELVRAGVVVVAAAGNEGSSRVNSLAGIQGGGLMSITDPGNAELAITVGSTHSDSKARGVSYFSSKGPTADGRQKPDLVAPGERMLSCVPDPRSATGALSSATRVARYAESTGGSAAVAFASGAIAALLSVRRHLIGRPLEVKRLLTQTAQDLQRDRYAQGHGAIDLMEALEVSSSPQNGRASIRNDLQSNISIPAEVLPSVSPSSMQDRQVADNAAQRDCKKRFVAALSYPGERREYVQKVVAELRRTFSRDEIFYAPFYQAELVGLDLDIKLERIYHDESEVIVVFVSSEYADKEWTGLEWRIVRDVMKRRRGNDVIPLRFDDTPIPGLLSIDAFIDLRDLDPEIVAGIIVEKIKVNRVKSST